MEKGAAAVGAPPRGRDAAGPAGAAGGDVPPTGARPGAGAVGGLAWAAWAAAAALTLADLVLLTVNYSTRAPTAPIGGPMEFASAAAYLAVATIGLTMLRHRAANRTGWAFLVAGVALAYGAFASEYATYGVLTDPGGLPGARWAAWSGVSAWWSGAALGLAFTLLLYPEGSLPSPRWRPWAAVALADAVVVGVLHAMAPGPLDGEYSIVVNPAGVEVAGEALRDLRSLGWALVLANAALGTAAAVRRARVARGAARRPQAWLAAAGAATVVATAAWGVGGGGAGRSGAVHALVVVGVLAVPVAVGLATARTAALRRSIERLVAAREEERRRIRRDLHDGLGPTLAGVALQLDLARSLIGTDTAAVGDILERLTGQVQVAVGDIRRLVDGLRPPVLDERGLVPAIEEGASSLARHSAGCDFGVTVASRGDFGELPPSVEVVAYRIVMEAVTNACRHGRASTCQVELALDDALRITVEDDGVGVPAGYRPGVGLASMRERAGELGGSCRLEPRAGGGTVVRVELPVTGA